MAEKHIDELSGVETTGHEWDGIRELNNPMPRWWVWTFYATIVWSIAYAIAYPSWPLLKEATRGVLGYSSRQEFAESVKVATDAQKAFVDKIAATPVTDIAKDPQLLQFALNGGDAAFKVNCITCHGTGAMGGPGYPNLNDDDWLWGGNLTEIEQTLTHGIRQPGDSATRTSLMPAFGRDGMLDSAQITAVAQQVLSFSGQGQASAAGAEIYANNCAICHGADGTGLRQFGAPNLADAIWLYGSGVEQVRAQVTNPRHGVMPAWGERLDPATIRMLAAYVHSLGGGEDFVEVAAEPATASDATPLGETDEQP